MNPEDPQLIRRLERHRTRVPAGFEARVMAELPLRRARKRTVWPARGQWIAPAFAGAAAALLAVFLTGRPTAPATAPENTVTFHFELHAPGADRVELLGSFNHWQANDIVLQGPDASGHWTAEVRLPEGRHEYIFLVDGEQWLADPNSAVQRPDGFGRVNSIIQVYEEDHA